MGETDSALMSDQGMCQQPARRLARCGVVALAVLLGCTARTPLLGKNGAVGTSDALVSAGAAGDSGATAGAAGQVGPRGGQVGSLPASGGSSTSASHGGTGGSGTGGARASGGAGSSGRGGAHASGGAGGSGTGGARASGGAGGAVTACLTDTDCPDCGSCGPEAECTPYHCRQRLCQLLCDECASDADCVIAHDITECCPTCPEAFPRALVAAEPCLVRPTETVPLECRPLDCPDMCELPACALDAQQGRCVQGACIATRCPRGYTGESCRPLTEADLGGCRSSADCIVVPYAHCCGATKRAINRLYLEEYHQHPEWQSYDGSCITMGVCADDSRVTTAICMDMFGGTGGCELVFP